MAVVTTYQNNEATFAFTSVTAFTLPSCRSRSSIVIKNSSAPVLTLTAYGSETIDAAATYAVAGNSTVKIVRNNTSTGWVVDDKVNLISSSPTVGIGYSTGAGGAQTQGTDKSTAVTSDTITTAITMHAANLAAATIVSFTFTNATIAATDTVLVTHQSAGTSGAYTLNAFPGAGSAVISVRNNTAGGLAEAIVLRVTVIKSVSA